MSIVFLFCGTVLAGGNEQDVDRDSLLVGYGISYVYRGIRVMFAKEAGMVVWEDEKDQSNVVKKE